MKKIYIIGGLFFIIALVTIFTSCETTVNINDYINKNEPFTLTVKRTDNVTGLRTVDNFVIPSNSDKFKKIIQWGNDNANGWQTTPASYIADIYLTQNNFRFLQINNGVVIGFADKDGISRQYTKILKKNELTFLTE